MAGNPSTARHRTHMCLLSGACAWGQSRAPRRPSTDPSPTRAQMDQVGERMAERFGYRPQQRLRGDDVDVRAVRARSWTSPTTRS
jgi:hypothetical protein